MQKYKTIVAEELEKAYSEGFKDAMNHRILDNIFIENDIMFELYCSQTRRGLEGLCIDKETIDNEIKALRVKRESELKSKVEDYD